MEGDTAETPMLFPTKVGEKLRAAREAQGLDLAEIAARTRIPQRHLEAIEGGNYSGLPSITYAIGFAKSYARAVNADEVGIARDLRSELSLNPDRAAPVPAYEMEDPSRVAPGWLAWVGLAVAALVLVGAILWYATDLFRGSAPGETLNITEETVAAVPDQSLPGNGMIAIPVRGQVSLVALDKVWVRVSDAQGSRLFEKELAAGERYDVPVGADHPRVRTGAPEKVQVTVNGSIVDGLGRPGQTVDVEVSAQSLLARREAGASPVPVPSPRVRAASATSVRSATTPASGSVESAPVTETSTGNSTATP